eukprot:5956820-Pleurochrysis_carterae.AAC.1
MDMGLSATRLTITALTAAVTPTIYLRNSVYARLLHRCAAGHYAAVVASPPCSTFSISRHCRSAASPDGGPPV